jgi:hypothetical protein
VEIKLSKTLVIPVVIVTVMAMLMLVGCGRAVSKPSSQPAGVGAEAAQDQPAPLIEVSGPEDQVKMIGLSVSPLHDDATDYPEMLTDPMYVKYSIVDGEIAQVTYMANYFGDEVDENVVITLRAKRTSSFEDISGCDPTSFAEDHALSEGDWGILRYNEDPPGAYSDGYAAWYNDEEGVSVSLHQSGPGPLPALSVAFYNPCAVILVDDSSSGESSNSDRDITPILDSTYSEHLQADIRGTRPAIDHHHYECFPEVIPESIRSKDIDIIGASFDLARVREANGITYWEDSFGETYVVPKNYPGTPPASEYVEAGYAMVIYYWKDATMGKMVVGYLVW